MYDCTAAMAVTLKNIKLLKENRSNQLLAEIELELEIAVKLMIEWHQIGNSIFWNTSRVGKRKGTLAKMSKVAFNAKTAFVKAKSAFHEFMLEVQISETDEVNRLLQIHQDFYLADLWFVKFKADCHQLQLSLLTA